MLTLTPLMKRSHLTSRLESTYVVPTSTTAFNLPSDRYTQDSGLPLQIMYPLLDAETFQNAHHRVAHPGMRWECPVRAMGGSNPRFYEIVRAPAGVTIGQWLSVDGDGKCTINREYGLLTWNNPTIGTHRFVIRCTDQYGRYVIFRWSLVCAVGKHLFMAPTARGTGDGSTYANAIGESSVNFNDNTAPSLNKVLVLCAGEYVSTNALILNKTTGAASAIGYPGETAIWRNKVQYLSSDCVIGFLTIKQVSTSDFGVVLSYGAHHRLSSFYNSFVECFNSNIPASNNQSIHGYSAAGTWRKNIVNLNNTYIDCNGLHAFDIYNVDTLLVQCETWITTNTPALLNQDRSVWFTKASYRHCEVSFNTYDNPHVAGRSQGVIQVYNETYAPGNGINSLTTVEYNFIRCASTEAAIFSNNASNLVAPLAIAITLTNVIHRNTCINGGIAARNWDYSNNANRRTFLSDNVIQTASGNNVNKVSVGGVDDSLWFTNPSTLFGISLTDTNGILNGSNLSLRGKKGAHVYI
jgi:hypothetical protein